MFKKSPHFSRLITNAAFNTKIKETEDEIFDILVTYAAFIAKIKEIVDLNKKITKLATKAELKGEQDKIVKPQTHDLSLFLMKMVKIVFIVCLFVKQHLVDYS